MRRILLIAVVAWSLGAVVAAAPAAAASCGTAVLKDWADGKIDGRYPVSCYQAALDRMPEDMRSYTTAPDDIRRALLARLRTMRTHHGELRGRLHHAVAPARAPARQALSAGGLDTTRATGFPLPLLVLAVVALLLMMGGSAGLVGRRLR
jgi:hypothetical protein